MHSTGDEDDDNGLDRGLNPEEIDREPPEYDHDRGCPKCDSQRASVNEIRTHGGLGSVLVDLPNNSFQAVSCRDCGYTEFYRRSGDDTALIDIFLE